MKLQIPCIFWNVLISIFLKWTEIVKLKFLGFRYFYVINFIINFLKVNWNCEVTNSMYFLECSYFHFLKVNWNCEVKILGISLFSFFKKWTEIVKLGFLGLFLDVNYGIRPVYAPISGWMKPRKRWTEITTKWNQISESWLETPGKNLLKEYRVPK